MSEKTKTTNRPTHAIWQVQGEAPRERWNRVGAGWMHKDLKGMRLVFDSMPLSGRVVVREIAEKENASDDIVDTSIGGAQ